jgi:predicted dehydrogenase
MLDMNRRTFLKRSVAGSAFMTSLAVRAAWAKTEPAEGSLVRIGIVGLGNRGTYLLRVLLSHPGVAVNALCDLDEGKVNRAIDVVRSQTNHTPVGYADDPEGYSRMLGRDDLDAILIATPTKWHCPMAVAAMKAGKHVASEVPAGFHLEELWELVKAKEASGKRYMLLENYIYDRRNMMVLNMVRQKLFADPYYAECAYLHDCRFMLFKEDGSLDWWGEWASKYYGHDYPTHAMGPVSKWLGLNEGDRATHCCAMMTKPRVLKKYTVKRFGADSEQAKIKWANGDFTSVMIQTANGRVIRNDYDVNSPRPVSYYYLLQGTDGIYDSRHGLSFEGTAHRWDKIDEFLAKYDHPVWRRWGEAAAKTGHGGGDWFVLRDFVEMVRQDREPWIDVYDAASWSVIYHCSKESIERKGASIDMPDFTNGRWKQTDWRKDHMKPT